MRGAQEPSVSASQDSECIPFADRKSSPQAPERGGLPFRLLSPPLHFLLSWHLGMRMLGVPHDPEPHATTAPPLSQAALLHSQPGCPRPRSWADHKPAETTNGPQPRLTNPGGAMERSRRCRITKHSAGLAWGRDPAQPETQLDRLPRLLRGPRFPHLSYGANDGAHPGAVVRMR